MAPIRRTRSTMLLTIVAAFFIIGVSSRAVNISNTWMLPEEGFPVFYRYFRDRISWNEADAVCQFNHANLVTVDTTSQFDAVRAYLKELDIANNVWIGLSRGAGERNFKWRDFRTLSLTNYWQEAIPAGSEAMCAAMDPAADFRWHSAGCSGPAVASFICELPVPEWAKGSQGCLVTELPSLTVLYIPERSAVELTSDCGLAGTKRIACKGSTNREDIMRELSCTESPDMLDDKTQSPAPTAINQDSTYASTNGALPKTTKPWTSNTIDTGDYGLPTRHRRETEYTVSPTVTKSTTDLSARRETTTEKYAEVLTTREFVVTTATITEAETSTVPNEAELGEEYPSAINQGQLFSIIENGTMFDIIELNDTDENKSAAMENKTPELTSTVSTLITSEPNGKKVAEQTTIASAVAIHTKALSQASLNDLPTGKVDKTLTKEVELFPVIRDKGVKLNRTDRKELPIAKPDRNINVDVDTAIQHETVEIRIHEPGQQNITKSTLFVTTRRSKSDKNSDEPKVSTPQTLPSDKGIANEAKSDFKSTVAADAKMLELSTESDFVADEEVDDDGEMAGTKTPSLLPSPSTPPPSVGQSFASEPTTKPNRQRQLTRPQRRSFYPYFFSRVLG